MMLAAHAVGLSSLFTTFFGLVEADAAGLGSLDAIGVDQITFETDYPRADGTWPHSKAVAEKLLGGLDDDTVRKIVRDNTIRLFQLALS
jgi:hypothetical protein